MKNTSLKDIIKKWNKSVIISRLAKKKIGIKKMINIII
jgi:hypothetical protein